MVPEASLDRKSQKASKIPKELMDL